MACITIAELNALTNTDLSADHGVTYLEHVLDSVCTHVVTYCRGTLFELTDVSDERHRAYVRARPPHPARLLVKTKYTPLNSVSTVKYQIGSTTTTIDITEAQIIESQGKFELVWYTPVYRTPDDWIILISYNAGHDGYPDDVKMAVALLAREWVDSDDAAAAGSRGALKGFKIGNYAEEYFSSDAAATGNLGLGTPLSIRAGQLLRKYRRPGVATGDR